MTDDVLARLRDERDAADIAYNRALTAVDRALAGVAAPGVSPLAPPDTARQAELNEWWHVVPAEPLPASGWRRRLADFVWRVVAPTLQKQEQFNAALVDHVNRTAAADLALRASVAESLALVRTEFDGLAAFHTELIRYLQEITPFIDTKDRFETADLRRQVETLVAGLDAVSDELLKRWETVTAGNRRLDSRLAAAVAGLNELRQAVGEVKGTAEGIRRGLPPIDDDVSVPPAPPQEGSGVRRPAPPSPLAVRPSDVAATYVSFEDAFRGTPDEVMARQQDYLRLFEGASDVLDIGCGRGEFLELLVGHGISARGVDINGEMVRRCQALGLDVTEADALSYLDSLPDGALGGLMAMQVVEHLSPDSLLQLLALAHRKLRPGSKIVLETINVSCWAAFFGSFIRDITHVRPLHPDTLRYLVTASGFGSVDVRFSAPYPEGGRLQRVPGPPPFVAPELAGVVQGVNDNIDRLNGMLFGWQDYAVVGERF